MPGLSFVPLYCLGGESGGALHLPRCRGWEVNVTATAIVAPAVWEDQVREPMFSHTQAKG